MKKSEFQSLFGASNKIKVSDFKDKSNRTLLFGYNLDRDSFHVYLEDDLIHRVVYSYPKNLIRHIFGNELDPYDLIPGKRVYPERTDFEFAKILTLKEIEIPFTSFDETVEERQYYGSLVSELKIACVKS